MWSGCITWEPCHARGSLFTLSLWIHHSPYIGEIRHVGPVPGWQSGNLLRIQGKVLNPRLSGRQASRQSR